MRIHKQIMRSEIDLKSFLDKQGEIMAGTGIGSQIRKTSGKPSLKPQPSMFPYGSTGGELVGRDKGKGKKVSKEFNKGPARSPAGRTRGK
jgi:hypothetical protein